MASYTEKQRIELINTICERIASGRSLRSVLTDEEMPRDKSFFSWINKDNERLRQYAGACEKRADSIFEDMMTIADSQEGDIITLGDGREVTNHDLIQRARLRVDTRKWILSKMNPKKYGEKLEVDSNVNLKIAEGITFDPE